jgi:hypothetical protein
MCRLHSGPRFKPGTRQMTISEIGTQQSVSSGLNDSLFEISVLLTPTKSGGSLCSTLNSLYRDWCDAIQAQLVVVIPPEQDQPALNAILFRIEALGIHVTVYRLDSDHTQDVPHWRALAFAQSSGRTCIFLEDNTIVESGWWRAWLNWARTKTDKPIATGLVNPDIKSNTYTETGVFYCEYGPFISAHGSGGIVPLKRVAGNHWAVRRESISIEIQPSIIDEHDWVHRYLKRNQKPDWNQDAVVLSYRKISNLEAFRERARQGYRFGKDQAVTARATRKILMIASGSMIVFVQLSRLLGVVIQRNHKVSFFCKILPTTGLLLLSWSLAEWCGWIAGSVASQLQSQFKNRTEPQCDKPEQSRAEQQSIINTCKAGT